MMLVKVQYGEAVSEYNTLHRRIIYQVKQKNHIIHAVWLQFHKPICADYGVLPQYIECISTALLGSNRGWCVHRRGIFVRMRVWSRRGLALIALVVRAPVTCDTRIHQSMM